MSEQLNYKFSFAKLITQEFALIENNFAPRKEVNTNINLSWGGNAESRVIGLAVKILFEIEKQPFIIIKVEGQFVIHEETWAKAFNPENKELFLQKNFMAHLGMLVIGSTRGILHAKLEKTPFNQILLPSINVQQMFPEDVRIKLT